MKVCDKCEDRTASRKSILIIDDDVQYDLCEKHYAEVIQFLEAKELKKSLFGKKKDSAQAG